MAGIERRTAVLIVVATLLAVGVGADDGAPIADHAELRIPLAPGTSGVTVTLGAGGVSLELPEGATYPMDFSAASGGFVRTADVRREGEGRVRVGLQLAGGTLDSATFDGSSVTLRFRRSLVSSPSDADTAAYRLGVDDEVTLFVAGQPALSRDLVVSQNGTVTAPLVGEVAAAGLTTRELASRLTDLLARDYLTDPKVDVQVKEFRSQWVLVTGAVRQPGKVALRGETSLKEVLGEAHGFLDEAGDEILLSHADSSNAPVRIDREAFESGAANPPVRAGDLVTVPRIDFVYLNGEVKIPGKYRIERGMTLLRAIAVAGGLTEWAKDSRVELVREGGKEPEIHDLREIRKGKAPDPGLGGGDMVYVGRRFL